MTAAQPVRTFLSVFRFVGRYWAAQWLKFLGVVVGLITAVIVEVQVPSRAADLVAALRGWAEAPGNDDAVLFTATVALLLTFAALSFTQQLYIRLYLHFTADVMRRMVNDGFGRVQRFGTDWHANNFAGATVRKITRGMWAYDGFADAMIIHLGPAMMLLIGFSVAMGIRDPWLGVYFGAAVTLFLVVTTSTSLLYVAPANELANEADTKMGGALADAITCNPVVKGFGAEALEDERMRRDTLEWRNRARRSWRRSVDAGALQSLMLVSLLGGLVALVFARAQGGVAQADDVVYVLTTYFVVNGYLRNVGWQIRELQRSVNELDDLVEIAATPPHVADKAGAKPFAPGPGAVRVEGVRFQYAKQKRPVFESLTVNIEAGEKIALVGPSGAGKTTFVKLLQRLYDIDGGRILVDGQDIREVTQESLRRSFAIVPQDPILFHRSLGDNIAYGAQGASAEAIEKAARQARAHTFIEKLPQGYDTLVGERGIKLSGGERQRVAIARAILADAPFLILDEATSSLDSATEHMIQQAIEEVLKGRTALLIAHRLSTVRRADRILVFEEGQIVEQGDHEDLIARPEGVYRRLHDMQALGFVDVETTNSGESMPAAS